MKIPFVRSAQLIHSSGGKIQENEMSRECGMSERLESSIRVFDVET
jgi:hypothetical protein